MPRNPLQRRLISIVEPVCEAAGYELFELRFLLEQSGWTLRVAVDLPLAERQRGGDGSADGAGGHPGGIERSERQRGGDGSAGGAGGHPRGIDLEDCENLSRELSAVLDVEDPIPQAYSLEVSSPGIDRPLRTPKHFKHFIGSEAKIQLALPLPLATGERRNFKGVLQAVEDEPVATVVIDCDGQAYRLPVDDIEHAKLVPDWDAVMKGQSGFGGVGKREPKPIKPGHRPSRKRHDADNKEQG